MDGTRRRVRRVLGHAVAHRADLADLAGGAVLVALMAAVRALWPVDAVPPGSWWIAAGGVVFTALGLRLHPAGPRRASRWAWLAGLSILLAAMFWAANQGLDLIRPIGSRRHDAAATVGGFELWAVLCPGLTIVALAGLVRSWVCRSHR